MKQSALFVFILGICLAGASSGAQNPDSGTSNNADSQTAQVPTPPLTAAGHADLFMVSKDYSAATMFYQDALKTDPKNAALMNKTGIAFQQLGDLNQAERFYRKAIRVNGKFASAINNLGTLDYQQGRYGRAIKSYKKAIAADGNSSSIYSNLGYAYYANKQFPQALQAFGKALAIDPQVFERRGGLGSIVQQRSAPDPGLFYFLLAKSFARSGDAEHAAHYLKLSRDDGYKDFVLAIKDPEFASVIKDPRVQEVLRVQPSYEEVQTPTTQN